MELISRELLLKVIHEEDIHTPDEMWKPAREWVDIFKSLPIIERRPTGRWIRQRIISPNRKIDLVICSECREEYSYDAETGVWMSDYRVCPKCGAYMRCEE